jgi:hypothetical protein
MAEIPAIFAPEGVAYERTAPQYAVRERVEMVTPPQTCCVATPPALQLLRLLTR